MQVYGELAWYSEAAGLLYAVWRSYREAYILVAAGKPVIRNTLTHRKSALSGAAPSDRHGEKTEK